MGIVRGRVGVELYETGSCGDRIFERRPRDGSSARRTVADLAFHGLLGVREWRRPARAFDCDS
jgi:hypothetical protein